MTPEIHHDLIALRHALHAAPELSGEEGDTAARIAEELRAHDPDLLLTELGGHGLAAVFEGGQDGPTVMIRAELDALPIAELSEVPHRSRRPGKGHLCGHDGHMVMVLALARDLAERRPARGRAVLLFQPAEETGKGAAALCADPGFGLIAPDYAFALHNVPGMELGAVALCTGPANCASRGMRVRLTGKTAHAAQPETGLSPAAAMTRLMPDLAALSGGADLAADYTLATLTHARLGEATFGVAPGEAELWVTLRATTDAAMQGLVARAEALVAAIAASEGLAHEIAYDDIFAACTNHPEAVAVLRAALREEAIHPELRGLPQRWSEDFGQFGQMAKTAMFWLGAGRNHPQLHTPDYDFPDALIPIGAGIFARALRQLLG